MVVRGLLLLGMMLVIVTMVWVVLMRSQGEMPTPDTSHPEVIALAIPNPVGLFPDQVNWGVLVALSENLPSSPGWQVRYNATLALARLGSGNLPFDVLSEMLDEHRQKRNFRMKVADGAFLADDYAAHRTILNALKATEDWHKHPEALKVVAANQSQLDRVYAAIDKLVESKNDAVREEAQRVKKSIRSKDA